MTRNSSAFLTVELNEEELLDINFEAIEIEISPSEIERVIAYLDDVIMQTMVQQKYGEGIHYHFALFDPDWYRAYPDFVVYPVRSYS